MRNLKGSEREQGVIYVISVEVISVEKAKISVLC